MQRFERTAEELERLLLHLDRHYEHAVQSGFSQPAVNAFLDYLDLFKKPVDVFMNTLAAEYSNKFMAAAWRYCLDTGNYVNMHSRGD